MVSECPVAFLAYRRPLLSKLSDEHYAYCSSSHESINLTRPYPYQNKHYVRTGKFGVDVRIIETFIVTTHHVFSLALWSKQYGMQCGLGV